MYRFKVEILIDEEKVIKDDKYEPKDMYDCIRKMFKRFHLPEIKTDKPYHLIFTDKGGKKDLGGLGAAVMDLYNSDWFRRYAEKFLWYERENKEFYKEDIFKELDEFEVKGI